MNCESTINRSYNYITISRTIRFVRKVKIFLKLCATYVAFRREYNPRTRKFLFLNFESFFSEYLGAGSENTDELVVEFMMAGLTKDYKPMIIEREC